jgi:hypothetical protein
MILEFWRFIRTNNCRVAGRLIRPSAALVYMKVFDIAPSEKQIGMDLILRSCKGFGVAIFGTVRAYILKGHRCIFFVDGIEGSLVTDILFGNQGDATPC